MKMNRQFGIIVPRRSDLVRQRVLNLPIEKREFLRETAERKNRREQKR